MEDGKVKTIPWDQIKDLPKELLDFAEASRLAARAKREQAPKV